MRRVWVVRGGFLRVACVCLVALGANLAQGPGVTGSSAAQGIVARPVVEGPHPFLTILCKFAGVPDEPASPAYFERLLGAQYPGLDDYWREVSYGHISLAGSKVVGWIDLPHNKAEYFPGGKPDFERLAQDCGSPGVLAAGPDFFGLNLVFNAGIGVPYGGRTCLDAGSAAMCYAATWIWPPYLFSEGTWAHETGHALGLSHTGRSAGRKYGSVWDLMSQDGGCGVDQDFGIIGQHPIAYHKDRMGWIPESAKLVLDGHGEFAFRLSPLARPAQTDGSYLLAEIPVAGSAEHFYTVEARTRTGYDANLLKDAVVIHEVDMHAGQEGSSPSVVVRWQGALANDPAAEFHDLRHAIAVSIDAQDVNGFSVRVRLGRPQDSAPGAGAAPTVDPAKLAGLLQAGPAGSGSDHGAPPSAPRADPPQSPAALAVDGRGRQHALWVAQDDGLTDVLRYAVREPGQPWSRIETIAVPMAPDALAVPALVAGPDGALYASWSQLEEGVWHVGFMMRTDDSSGWTRSEMISSDKMGDAWAPTMVVDSRGRVYVAWRSDNECGQRRSWADILLRVRDENAVWQPIERVDAASSVTSAVGLRPLVDPTDNIYVAWKEIGPEGVQFYVAGRSPDAAAGGWEVARDESKLAARPTS